MTDQEIIIEVAKLDGYNQTGMERDSWYWTKIPLSEYSKLSWEDKSKFHTCVLPQYLTSRDAIIPVIEKVITDPDTEMVFNYALYALLTPETWSKNAMTYVMAVKATPKQLCIALLNATGKWKE